MSFSSRSGSLYIGGRPGTGKTALIDQLGREAAQWGDVVVKKVNCMRLSKSRSVFDIVAEQLECRSSKKEHIEAFITRKGPMIALVLDEVDQLSNDVLYSVFEWPALPQSRLLLLAIANRLDLTERYLSRLKCEPTQCLRKVVNFPPYEPQELKDIVSERLGDGLEVFSDAALELCCRKVAAASGDARRVLDLCRCALEEKMAKNPPAKWPLVDISFMSRVVNSCLRSNTPLTVSQLPQQQQTVLAVLVLQTIKKNTVIPLEMMQGFCTRACTRMSLPEIAAPVSGLCEMLAAEGLVRIEKKRGERLILLYAGVDDVCFGLRGAPHVWPVLKEIGRLGVDLPPLRVGKEKRGRDEEAEVSLLPGSFTPLERRSEGSRWVVF